MPRFPEIGAERSIDSAIARTASSTSAPATGTWKRPNSLAALRLLDPAHTEGRITVDAASYFLSKLELTAGKEPTMAAWRNGLFIATSYITADAAQYFGLPRDRTGGHGCQNRGLGSGLRLQDDE